jgi:hypothetical protein
MSDSPEYPPLYAIDFSVFYQGLPQLARHNEEDPGDELGLTAE